MILVIFIYFAIVFLIPLVVWGFMLSNHVKYVDIVKKTGASTATISRVKRSLDYDNTGYDLVLPRMEDKE